MLASALMLYYSTLELPSMSAHCLSLMGYRTRQFAVLMKISSNEFKAILKALKEAVSSEDSDIMRSGVSNWLYLWLRLNPLITNSDSYGRRISSLNDSSNNLVLLTIFVITVLYFSASEYLYTNTVTLKSGIEANFQRQSWYFWVIRSPFWDSWQNDWQIIYWHSLQIL